MTETHKNLPYIIFVAVLSLTIIGYNYWSYKCGYCTLASLMQLSTPAMLLIGCNLLAGLALLVIRLRKQRQAKREHCACGETLRSIWHFCPSCGHARKS